MLPSFKTLFYKGALAHLWENLFFFCGKMWLLIPYRYWLLSETSIHMELLHGSY